MNADDIGPRDGLKLARKEAGLSKKALAGMLGVTVYHINDVEWGFKDATPDLMVRWTKALGTKGLGIWSEQDIERLKRLLGEQEVYRTMLGSAA